MKLGEGLFLEGELGVWRELLGSGGKSGIVHTRMKREEKKHVARWERME